MSEAGSRAGAAYADNRTGRTSPNFLRPVGIKRGNRPIARACLDAILRQANATQNHVSPADPGKVALVG